MTHKLDIDTLVFSGGGPSGIAYFGIIRSLLEKNIINENLDGINEIITTSIGILPAFCLMIKMNMDIAREITLGFDISKMLDIDNISMDSILVDFGLFSTDGIRRIFKSILKHIKNVDDFTLKELYDISKVKLTVKVFNATKKQLEYISYENYPELSIITLAEMTTAIPFFFKPVEYKSSLYVDGGLRGHFPIEQCTSEKYLGIFIKGGSFKEFRLFEIFPILEFMYSLMINQDQTLYDIQNNITKKRIIFAVVDYGLNFYMPKDKKLEIIKKGYEVTNYHIRKHLAINKV